MGIRTFELKEARILCIKNYTRFQDLTTNECLIIINKNVYNNHIESAICFVREKRHKKRLHIRSIDIISHEVFINKKFKFVYSFH